MRVPATVVEMTFSYGSMTGRKVNGEVRLLMTGDVTKGDPLYELVDTGTYDANYATAPRMSLARNWGDIYGTARRTWLSDGTEKTGYPRYPGGLHWNDGTQLLYWTYYDAYNTTGGSDWCLGATRLDASGPAAFGPWRPSGEGKAGAWRCRHLGTHPSGAMVCGSTIMSGNINAPWGPDLWTTPFPTRSNPLWMGRS